MNKKVVIGIISIILIALVVLSIVIFQNKKHQLETSQKENNVEPVDENKIHTKSNKILVVYYSAQKHTKAVAEKIADKLKADIFEIVPEEIYTSADLEWNNSNSRVSKEHDDESLRNVKLKSTKVQNWEDYDTVLIGYPIWWGMAAWPVDTFVKANDFNEKTVIPFCTSASSGLGQSGELLRKNTNSGNWLEGCRFESNASNDSIETWVNNLKQELN